MKDYNTEKIATLNDEELDNLIKILLEEKTDRKDIRQSELISAFEEAWRDLEEEGIEIWFSGNEYTDDFRLKFNEVYFD